MLEIGHIFLYGDNGVCQIDGIKEQEYKGELKKYYIIKPLYNFKSTIFIPVDSEIFTSRMHELISREEIKYIINTVCKEKPYWIEDNQKRLDCFNEYFDAYNRYEIYMIYKSIISHRSKLKDDGKRLRATDEKCLKKAEKIIVEEVATVLEMPPEKVLDFVFNK